MVLAKHLPTAVDFTNSLVNYIEVTLKDIPATSGLEALIPPELHTTPAQPVDVLSPSHDEIPKQDPIHPPLTLPPTPQLGPLRGSPPPAMAPDMTKRRLPKPPQAVKKRYTREIPHYLRDVDGPEHSDSYRRAAALTDRLPSPPSLPMFLNKHVLNGVTPMKDDASVLILPNHTVLNHLATSSIKNGVIATSATTRYKKKVCILPQRSNRP
jgi:5'-AMP-activated protein kinase beta subunit, interaction domain